MPSVVTKPSGPGKGGSRRHPMEDAACDKVTLLEREFDEQEEVEPEQFARLQRLEREQ